MSIKALLERVLKRIPRWITLESGTAYATTTANTWEYTGISVTVPTNHVYQLQVQMTYNSSRPIGIGFHGSTSIATAYSAPLYNSHSESTSIACCMTGFILQAGTWYLFTKTAGTGSNNLYVRGLDIYISK